MNCYIEETYGYDYRKCYRVSHSEIDGDNVLIEQHNKKWQSVKSLFMTVFLPHGFPESVSKDYLEYQIWDSIQAFSSSVNNNVCMHAVLKGVGVGDESASPLAATITWLIKDSTSMIGRILFAWLQGTKLDSECKQWRLFADVINDMAMFLDLISGFLPHYFTAIVCVSGLLKAIVGVAGGSTRAALTQHQARQNNMADVAAKDGSQETLVNLLAVICSLVIVPAVVQNIMFIWILYFVMTFLHITANYMAVKCVKMETFNKIRFRIFAQNYIKDSYLDINQSLSVEEVNQKEKLFFPHWFHSADINLGTSFQDLTTQKSCKDIIQILELYKDCNYILSVSEIIPAKAFIKVVYREPVSALTCMESMLQACHVEHILLHGSYKEREKQQKLDRQQIEIMSRNYTKLFFNDFIEKVEKQGFNVRNVLFDVGMWRAKWHLKKE